MTDVQFIIRAIVDARRTITICNSNVQKARRPVNVMVLLDASEAVVDNFARRGGFEAGQALGTVPESIMVGISTLEFTLKGTYPFDQRGYELTYEQQLPDNQTCVLQAGGAPTGGSDLLLEWIDNVVLPAALAAVGMDRGEVAIAGGSLGGLTACYAASKYPDVFERAICMSPSNCFNYGSGGFANTIKANAAANLAAGAGRIGPKSVIQFHGGESVLEEWGGQTQYDFLARDELAWCVTVPCV